MGSVLLVQHTRACDVRRQPAGPGGERIAQDRVGGRKRSDEARATYLDYQMPYNRREEVRRLGACWDAIRSRYYVPAGVGVVAFEGWRERPPMS